MNKVKCGISLLLIICISINLNQTSEAAEYKYDKLNRVIQVTYEDGRYITYTYDANGNIESISTFLADGTEINGFTPEGSYLTVKNPNNLVLWSRLVELEKMYKNLALKNFDFSKLPIHIQESFHEVQELLEQKQQLPDKVGAASAEQIFNVLNIEAD